MDPTLTGPNAALFDWAYRAFGAGRHDAAIAVARLAARAMPGLKATETLVDLLSRAGKTAEARTILASGAAGNDGSLGAILAQVAVHEGQLEEAVTLLERCLTEHPAQRYVRYALTSVLPHLGRFEETNRHADFGVLIRCGDLQLTSSRVIRFPGSNQLATPVVPFNRNVWHEAVEVTDATDAVYFAGCDSRYFLLFGEALIKSLARNAGARLAFHLHLINPNSEAEALLERLRRDPPLPIVASRERVNISDFGARQQRTYLSCARYLLLPELLERYHRPILVADADQLVVADLRPLLRDFPQHDIGLLRNDLNIANIISLISASVVMVNPTPGGLRFARTLRDTIAERMADPAGFGWHLDQAALAVSHLWHHDIRTLRLPVWIMDSMIDPAAAADKVDPRALFWSITLSFPDSLRKLETSLFRQYLN